MLFHNSLVRLSSVEVEIGFLGSDVLVITWSLRSVACLQAERH